jgi:hypothetical protein
MEIVSIQILLGRYFRYSFDEEDDLSRAHG